jgi:hypothetical protein
LAGDDVDAKAWQGRGHFLAAAAEAMRRILVEAPAARPATNMTEIVNAPNWTLTNTWQPKLPTHT